MASRAKPQTTLSAGELPPLPAQRTTLRVVDSPDPKVIGATFDLDGSSFTFGRNVTGRGLIDDPRMSREHAALRPGEQAYIIEDLGTRNGTFLNGARLERPGTLLANDIVSIGDSLLVVDREIEADQLPIREGARGDDVVECAGISYAAQRMRASIATTASARGPVLILGPTGSGKEIAARAIHRLSERSGAPWVPVNCGAIPPDLAEAELFGAKKGAFTGADRDREGSFLQAAGGTIFLDEIGDLPPAVQVKLLRVLEDGIIQPLGSQKGQKVDVRVIAATHKDLSSSGFRRDLLARMSGWVLHLPALAERRSDILTLWRRFFEEESRGRAPSASSATFAEALLLYSWPMNVRELKKLAERIAVVAEGAERLDVSHLPESMQRAVRARSGGASGGRVGEGQKELEARGVMTSASAGAEGEGAIPEQAVLIEALRRSRGNVAHAARKNGWHKTQLYRWLRRYNIDPNAFREPLE